MEGAKESAPGHKDDIGCVAPQLSHHIMVCYDPFIPCPVMWSRSSDGTLDTHHCAATSPRQIASQSVPSHEKDAQAMPQTPISLSLPFLFPTSQTFLPSPVTQENPPCVSGIPAGYIPVHLHTPSWPVFTYLAHSTQQ